MPESWFSKEQQPRRKANLVPQKLVFQTKPQIAAGLIDQVMESGDFPTRWIGCDATFGTDSHFLNTLPRNLYYFADIRCDTLAFTKKPDGVVVTAVLRGEETIAAPGGDLSLQGGDTVILAGTSAALDRAQAALLGNAAQME